MNQNDVFLIIGVLSLGTALIHYLSKKCLQSKCETCDFCFGLVQIKRNAQIETDEHQFDIEHNVRPSTDSVDIVGNTINNAQNIQPH